jgi:hypothetical protein
VLPSGCVRTRPDIRSTPTPTITVPVKLTFPDGRAYDPVIGRFPSVGQ